MQHKQLSFFLFYGRPIDHKEEKSATVLESHAVLSADSITDCGQGTYQDSILHLSFSLSSGQ